jgi:phage-related protein
MFRVFFYISDKGRVPVREFLDDLTDPRAKAQIIRVVQRLAEAGFLPEPFSRAMVGSRKLRELRVAHGGNIYRVFYSLVSGRRILLLHGFVKKTGKTPPNEIRIAEARLKQFLEGEHEEKN